MQIDNNIQVDRDLQPLIAGFMDRRVAEIPQMEQLYSEMNFEEFKKLGHKLKGSCLNYGFAGLGKLAAQMETAASNQDLPQIRQIIDTIKSHIENVNITFIDSSEE